MNEDIGRTMDAVGCTEKQAEDILEEINRQKKIAKFEEQQRILSILRIKCLCRIRGLKTDISCGYKHEGRLDEYEELLRHLKEIKWIVADIECGLKYLSDNERKTFYDLIGGKNGY